MEAEKKLPKVLREGGLASGWGESLAALLFTHSKMGSWGGLVPAAYGTTASIPPNMKLASLLLDPGSVSRLLHHLSARCLQGKCAVGVGRRAAAPAQEGTV